MPLPLPWRRLRGLRGRHAQLLFHSRGKWSRLQHFKQNLGLECLRHCPGLTCLNQLSLPRSKMVWIVLGMFNTGLSECSISDLEPSSRSTKFHHRGVYLYIYPRHEFSHLARPLHEPSFAGTKYPVRGKLFSCDLLNEFLREGVPWAQKLFVCWA